MIQYEYRRSIFTGPVYREQAKEAGVMANEKYVCPECGEESEKPGQCPNCQVELVAICPVCGNPIVGEHIHP